MRWFLLLPVVVFLHSTCFADDGAFSGSQPITEKTIANLCETFPNCFTTVQQSLKTLEAAPDIGKVAQGIERVADPSTEQYALYFLARAFHGLTKAEATLSDAELGQKQARMKIGHTNRPEVLELLRQAEMTFNKMHLGRKAVDRIAALHFF